MIGRWKNLHFLFRVLFSRKMSVIFSELIEDYFLSNIKSDIFGDDNTPEEEQLEISEYPHGATAV